MSVSTFSSDFVHTALIQMGANQIKVVSGKQMVITFDLGNGLDLEIGRASCRERVYATV